MKKEKVVLDLNKRGEKELQMIFGLFILLIITLVVLNLFLQSSKKGFSQVEQSATKELKEQEVQRLRLSCQAVCDAINDVNSAIEFCAKLESLDSQTSTTTIAQRVRYGRFEFCQNKVPCFLIIDNCQNGLYTMDTCKRLLLSDEATWDLYNKLVTDVGPIPAVTESDGCGLQEFDPADPTASAANWKLRGDYVCDAATAAVNAPQYNCV